MGFDVHELSRRFDAATLAKVQQMTESIKGADEATKKEVNEKIDEYKHLRGIEKQKEAIEWQQTFDAKALQCCEADLAKKAALTKHHRMPFVFVPESNLYLGLEDADGNQVHRFVVYRKQAEDCIKALRRKGTTSKVFDYDKEAWNAENLQRQELKEKMENKTNQLNEVARSCFQTTFVSLMHLKVIRAYIDGVLRFGIPPRFYMGVLFPKHGQERQVLLDMTKVLSEDSMREMYGEKIDASEADDFWPFVCISLTSPSFLHAKEHKE